MDGCSCLASVDRLARWGIQVPKLCVLCDVDTEETHAHLFFECKYSTCMFQRMLVWLKYHRTITTQGSELARLSSKVNNKNPKNTILEIIFAVVVYHIWSERNNRRFQNQKREALDRAKEIVIQVHITGQKTTSYENDITTLQDNYSLL